MSHGPSYFPSKGVCIYCDRSDLRLTDEHILPYFIGGAHVISDASCDDCARITSRFELDVSRHLWGDARISFNAPSRRKKKRPKYILMPDDFNPSQSLRIPVEEYPAAMVFYRMHQAGILQGFSDEVDLSGRWELVSIVDRDRIDRFIVKYGQPPKAKFRHVPDSFARLLAKIAYGQVLCTLDPNEFRAICIPYILGEKKNLSYIVGGRWSYEEAKSGIGYELRTNCIRFPDRLIIVVEIQLVANSNAPTYHVVVGDVVGQADINRIYDKIDFAFSIDIADVKTYRLDRQDEFHWVPSVWPLPDFSKS